LQIGQDIRYFGLLAHVSKGPMVVAVFALLKQEEAPSSTLIELGEPGRAL
jgi:hypothetical protein